MIKTAIHRFFREIGYEISRYEPEKCPPDFRAEEIDIVKAVRPWTMTGPERIYALIQALRYVSANGIAGDIIECGVWKGGSMAAVARTLLQINDAKRDLYLFDTFEGMTDPTSKDTDHSGTLAANRMKENPGIKCDGAPLEGVKRVLIDTGYPKEKIHFVQGKVEETIPDSAPNSISLLRLDTDWYESTKHELIHLFPRLSPGGVIIIDDYGHWRGCRQACDEYFSEKHVSILLNRIDDTGRIAVKP
jgi:O-methyltransferase